MLGETLFFAQVMLRGEPFLARLSAPQSALMEELEGRSVAIVGNARSLAAQRHGAAIDAHDIVIRMHRAPLPTPESHGTRTDWLALGMPVPQELIEARAPKRLLWMARKRKRVRRRIARHPGFYRHPVADWDALARELGAPPSTGALVTDLVQRSRAARITLFGFDFFASLSASGRRTAEQVPHDWAAERARVMRLMEEDGRLALAGASD